jgi:hypothetical protein
VGFWWGSGCHGGLFPAINISPPPSPIIVLSKSAIVLSQWFNQFKISVQDKMSNNTLVQDTSNPSEATDRNDDDAAQKKRKRKGFGNWTRSALACDRCRKKKIKVLPIQSTVLTSECVEEKPCANCVSAAVDCITSQNGTQHAAKPYY